jgi:hypothetical protein|tara:strand:+ start:789 stop:986 length:198 start_codon:yes stop_codon:yes gene_type:complete
MERYQVKSHWYYWFWSIATVSVVAGQLYVGTGYRRMADSFESVALAIGEIQVAIIVAKSDAPKFY